MLDIARNMPVFVVLATVLVLHAVAWHRLARTPAIQKHVTTRRWLSAALLAGMGLIAVGAAFGFTWVVRRVPSGSWVAWTRAGALVWAMIFAGLCLAAVLWQRVPSFDPKRRWWLKSAAGTALTAPVAACGWGTYVARSQLTPQEVDVWISGLPRDLDGLRMAQLTDIHLGAFLSRPELARAVGMANEWRPHLALVTGDFITDRGDPLDGCLTELAGLRASDGVYGCCGNHEGYIHAEAYCARKGAELGIEVLRDQAKPLRFGAAVLNLAGVDHQRPGRVYLPGAERLIQPGAVNVLLSHNPDPFPVAAQQGFQLVVAGHTHGGQLALELRGVSVSVSRFFTPFVRGLYRLGPSQLYVSSGIGTVGVPLRLGVPPEVTLVRLRSTQAASSGQEQEMKTRWPGSPTTARSETNAKS